MRKPFRFTLRKKVFLLTAALSVALIGVSVTIASVIFNNRIKNEANELCRTSAEVLSEYLETYDMLVTGSGDRSPFVRYYIDKLDNIYKDNREEILAMSAKGAGEEEFAEKKQYFQGLTAPLFGGGGGFGVSYDLLSFRNAYAEIIEEMERMSTIDGVISCELFYYDEENGNLVFLCDSASQNDLDYLFPGSAIPAPDSFLRTVRPDDRVTIINQNDEFASYAPIRLDGVTVAYVTFEYSIDSMVASQRTFMWTLIGIMLIATVFILVLALIATDRSLVRNITALSEAARSFTSHMEEEEIQPVTTDIRTRDEIRDLSDDFLTLQNKVIVYSEDIARKRATEERMQAELAIASKIQLQSLPDRPLIADGICVSSFIKPAKEVGGDLFDYFVTDEGKIFFVIADVSGKGVPAALFMMRGKEIIRSCAKAGMTASRIAQTANRELFLNNREGLFITAFIGIYDPADRTLRYVRAGHEQPFLLRNGKSEKIGEESNFVLGLFEGTAFAEDSLEIREGDRILLYTDGLNEGINKDSEEFGYERIRSVLEDPDDDILDRLYDSAARFADGAEQFDDITMLLFEAIRCRSFILESPKYEDIPAVTDQINEFVKGYDPDKTAELDVILDEMMNNAISYAFTGIRKPRLEICVRILDGNVQLTLTDNGTLFDPLSAAEPDVGADIRERPAGGMGIMLVKTVADRISYRVINGQNRLTIHKDLRPDPVTG